MMYFPANAQMVPSYKRTLNTNQNRTEENKNSIPSRESRNRATKTIIQNPYKNILRIKVIYVDASMMLSILPYNEITLPRNESCTVMTDSKKSKCMFPIKKGEVYILKYDKQIKCYRITEL